MDLGFGAGPRGAHVTVPHEALLPHFTMAETPASIMNEARRIMQAPADNYISDEQLTRCLLTYSHPDGRTPKACRSTLWFVTMLQPGLATLTAPSALHCYWLQRCSGMPCYSTC